MDEIDEIRGEISRTRAMLEELRRLLHPLVCVECEESLDRFARGWRAFLGREDDSVVVVVYCPRCAREELDDEDA